MATINEVISYFEERYPPEIRDLAYDEKNTELLYGSKETELTSIVVSLECSLEVIAYAVEKQANLIVCHHTPFFRPIYKYDDCDYRVQVLKQLIKYDIAVYCSHTAVDRAKPEHNMSGFIANLFDFTNIQPFEQEQDGYGVGVQADVHMTQQQLLDMLKRKVGSIRTNQVDTAEIKKVGIVGGEGDSHWRLAKAKGCDAFLTGDVTFHTAQDANRENFLIIDIGHQTEGCALVYLHAWLAEKFPAFFFQQKGQILQ